MTVDAAAVAAWKGEERVAVIVDQVGTFIEVKPDTDGSGLVDFDDISSVIANWGACRQQA